MCINTEKEVTNTMIDNVLKDLEKLRVRFLVEKEHEESVENINNSILGKDNRKLEHLLINGYPVYHFIYEGTMPLYDEGDSDYKALIREYYYEATFNLYDFTNVTAQFDNAVLIIEHHFNDSIIRDLDNRNRKYLIDAIRHTGLVNDDDYKNLSILEEGYETDKSPFLSVFLLEANNLSDFLVYKKNTPIKTMLNLVNRTNLQDIKNRHIAKKEMNLQTEKKFNKMF